MEKNKFFVELCRRETVCSMKKAMLLAARSDYDPELVKVIIERKDCSFPCLWELLSKTQDILWAIKSAAKNDSFKEISYNQFLSLFVGSKKQRSRYHYDASAALKIIAERKILNKFSGEQLLSFSKEFGYEYPIISNLGRKDYWKKMSKDSAFGILKETYFNFRYNECLASIFIERKDCGLREALEILKHVDDSSDIFSSIVGRKDFELSDILSNLKNVMGDNIKEYSSNDIILRNFEQIVARPDCSLTLAYELLEIARKYGKEYGREYSVSPVMALIERRDVPFNKALALMEEIECHQDAIASFEKRTDFDLGKRIRLVKVMDRLASVIYERGEEPKFSTNDQNKIIANGDWISLPLRDALRLCQSSGVFFTPLRIISERKDWEALSLSQAIELAAERGNRKHISKLILATKNCPLDKALELAKSRKGKSGFYDAELASLIIRLKISSWEESLQILEKSDDPFWTASVLVERKDVSLRTMVDLLTNGFSDLCNVFNAASKHEDWKTIPLEEAFDFLSKFDFFQDALFTITAREDWRALPFQAANNFLNKIDWSRNPWPIIWSLTEKEDCPLELALKFVGLLDPKSDIRQAVIPVIARLDNPLEEALELAKNSCYGAFQGITLRKDWKELTLSQVYQYLQKYPDHDLINSLAERDDWKALTMEEAEKELFSEELYARLLYLGLVVRQETHSLEEVLSILEKNKYDSTISNQFIRRSDCPLELVSVVFRKSDFSATMFQAISKNERWINLSLEEACEFAKKTSLGLFSLIAGREDWKALSLAKVLRFVEKYDYNPGIIQSIFGRADWRNM